MQLDSNRLPYSQEMRENLEALIEPPNPKRRVPIRHTFRIQLTKCKIIRRRRGKTSNISYIAAGVQTSGEASKR